jgi:hypothetical protein
MNFRRICFLTFFILAWIASAQTDMPKTETVKGWISEEQCAKSQARTGVSKGTNPDCARDCVARGKKIAFIDPAGKRVLVIANQDTAKDNLGDYVEITGEVGTAGATLRIDSIQLLKKGKSASHAPVKKDSTDS